MIDQTLRRLNDTSKTLSALEKRKKKNWIKKAENSESYAGLIEKQMKLLRNPALTTLKED